MYTQTALQRHQKILEVTGPKLTKFSSDVQESSAMLRQQLVLRHSHRMLSASAQNKDGVCQFSRHASQIGYHSNVPTSQFQYNIIKPKSCSIFAESLVDHSRNSGENNANVRILPTYIHPPHANAPQDVRGYWTKVQEIFISEVERSSSVLMQ